jgi:methyl-accepting chemotaxis protein
VVDGVNAEVAVATAAGSAITSIREAALRVVGVTHDISAALREQSLASESIAQKVERIAQMSDENTVALTHIKSASSHMAKLSQDMHTTVALFRVNAAEAVRRPEAESLLPSLAPVFTPDRAFAT